MKSSLLAVVLWLLVVVGATPVTNWLRAEEAFCTCRYCAVESHSFLADAANQGNRYQPIRHVDVLHIKLDITPDFEQRTVGGTTTIQFSPLRRPVTSIELDAENLTITQVTGSVPVKDFFSTDTSLEIAFQQPIPVGQKVEIQIEHHCQPDGGFYFRTEAMGYPAEDTHCWTQGEPHYARKWFPCFDYPNERSTTEVVCHVPQGMIVLSNGKKLGESIDPQTKLKVVHWRQDIPHVTYLLCVVAGYFDMLEDDSRGIPLRFYVQPSLSEYAPSSFQDTAKIMDFFHREIGVDYPWDKYDQVTIHDFIAGGMENTTLTTLTTKTLYDDSTENIRTSHGLDAHELAHQWFGDYLTCEDWSHLWLNEGFATYYTHLYEGDKNGRDAMLYGLYKDATNRVLTQAKDKKAIVWNKYNSPWEQFDYRAYPKGSWVLHMLRSELGEDLYRNAIQEYLKRNALGTVVTSDLKRTIEQVSGRSFDRFFDQWVFHARFPDLKITHKYLPEKSLAHITIEQTQPISDDVLLFEFPATLAFYCNGKEIRHTEFVSQKKHEWFISLPSKPEFVSFDPDYTLLARVTFDQPEAQSIVQLEKDENAISRIMAIRALAKKKSDKAIAAIGKALESDSFFGVRVEAAKHLGKIGNEKAIEALVNQLDQQDARVRLAVVEGLGSSYQPEKIETYLAAAQSESNPSIQAAWLKGLAIYHDPVVVAFLNQSIKRQSLHHIIADAASDAMLKSKSPTYFESLAESLAKDHQNYTSRDLRGLLEAVGQMSHIADRRIDGVRAIQPFLNDPRQDVQESAIKALGKTRAEVARPILETFTDEGDAEQLRKAATASLKQIGGETVISPSELGELRKRLKELEDANRKLEGKIEAIEKQSKASKK